MSESFYSVFEERYRGSRDAIKSRLQIYLSFSQPLLEFYPYGTVLDLGCGRGEWLELTEEHGFDAFGVDLDEGMLQACKELGFKVEVADAIAYMQSLSSGTVAVVSGFHIAEHLPFEKLQQLVQEAFRILVPGGLLILETPNPENISVGSNTFYLDPKHERPLPPELLSFLPEFYGFARSKILRLQESQYLSDDSSIGLWDVLSGVSPDYAVVAQKLGSLPLMRSLDAAFERELGVTLHNLTARYQQALDRRLAIVEAASQRAQERAAQAEMLSQQVLERAAQAEMASQQVLGRAVQAEANLSKVYTSTSWRLTAPLRWSVHQLRLLREYGFKLRCKSAVKRFLQASAHYVVARPSLHHFAKRLVHRLGLAKYLNSIVKRLLTDQLDRGSSLSTAQFGTQGKPVQLKLLNRSAEQIYQDLKSAMQRHSDRES